MALQLLTAASRSASSSLLIQLSTAFKQQVSKTFGATVSTSRWLSAASDDTQQQQSVTNESPIESVPESLQSYGSDRRRSVAIIGAGAVGAACAQALVHNATASRIVMVDINTTHCEGEVMDIADSGYLSRTAVVSGNLSAAGQAHVVLLAAGAKQKSGESRVELIDRNVEVLRSVCNGLKPFGPDTVLMVVANPCDMLTTIAQRLSGLPHHRVFGSGTMLDSLRFRGEIANSLQISPDSVAAMVVGEHGDSQVALWSSANVAGVPVTQFDELSDTARQHEIAAYARDKAQAIIQRKGATCFGIASCAARLCQIVLRNEQSVVPISCWSDAYGMYASQPAVLGITGVQRVLPMNLSLPERSKFEASVKSMRNILNKVKID